MTDSKVIEQLNNLIQINIDASKGYGEVSKGISDLDLKNYFHECSLNRKKFATSLSNSVKIWGEQPTTGSSVTATIHRAWIDIKKSFSDDEKVAMLNECIRGEEEAVETYKEALESTVMPADMRNNVAAQYQTVKNTLRQIKEWKALFEKETFVA